jgi:shikimate dehydrogenase
MMQQIVMIGSPLAHVRSPAILNPMLRASGLRVEVVTHEVTAGGLDAFAAATRNDAGIVGLIVTTPLKQAVPAYLDRRTPIVGLIGAANCVRCEGPFWTGANFDGFGLIAAIRDRAGPLSGHAILLVGCGGAGSAIAASLVAVADVDLRLHDREIGKATDLASRLARFAPRSTISAIPAPTAGAEIVINASSAGMDESDSSPLAEETVGRASIVVDIIVGENTALKRDARRLGKTLIEGEAMVRGQAAYLQHFILGTTSSERDVLAA